MEENRSQFDDFSSGRIHRKEPAVELADEDKPDEEDDVDPAEKSRVGLPSIVVPAVSLFLPIIVTASVAVLGSYVIAFKTTVIVFPLAAVVCCGSTVFSILKWAYLGSDTSVKLYRVGTFVGAVTTLLLIVTGATLAAILVAAESNDVYSAEMRQVTTD